MILYWLTELHKISINTNVFPIKIKFWSLEVPWNADSTFGKEDKSCIWTVKTWVKDWTEFSFLPFYMWLMYYQWPKLIVEEKQIMDRLSLGVVLRMGRGVRRTKTVWTMLIILTGFADLSRCMNSLQSMHLRAEFSNIFTLNTKRRLLKQKFIFTMILKLHYILNSCTL